MRDLTAGFDPTQHEPAKDFEPLPPSWYHAHIDTHTTKATKAGTGHYLELVFEVQKPTNYAGRRIWQRLNLDNPNETAVEIAQQELAAICEAIGIDGPLQSADDLVGKTMEIKVAVRPAKGQYSASNEIKAYRKEGMGALGADSIPGEGASRGKKAPALDEPDDSLPF